MGLLGDGYRCTYLLEHFQRTLHPIVVDDFLLLLFRRTEHFVLVLVLRIFDRVKIVLHRLLKQQIMVEGRNRGDFGDETGVMVKRDEGRSV